MDNLKNSYKKDLYSVIEDIESNSKVEIVTMIKSQSGVYRDISFFYGAVILFLAYSFFMFSPPEFDVYLIYFFTIAAFVIGFSIVEFISPIKSILISKKRKNKQVEIYARAIFQKAGIRHTKDKIGVFIYVSVFEKQTYIIADRGAEMSMPNEDWEEIKAKFQNVFSTPDFYQAVIESLQSSKPFFSKYLPPVENDVNELPDNLDVDI